MFGSLSSVYSELDGRVELGERLTKGGPRKLSRGTRIVTTQSVSQRQKFKAWFIKAKFKARWKEELSAMPGHWENCEMRGLR